MGRKNTYHIQLFVSSQEGRTANPCPARRRQLRTCAQEHGRGDYLVDEPARPAARAPRPAWFGARDL